MTQSISKLYDRLESVFIFFALGSIVMLIGLTVADAGGRYLLMRPITGAYEVSEQYLMVFSFFFALCYSYRSGANIRVTFVVSRIPQKVKLYINYLVQILSILYCISLLFTSIIVAINRFHEILYLSTSTSSYDIPLAPAYIAVPAGLLLMSLRMTFDLWHVKKGSSSLLKG